MVKLLTIEQAAKLLNVPKGSLRAAAEEHGFLVRMGRAIRLDEYHLGDLVEKCKVPPKPSSGPTFVQQKSEVGLVTAGETDLKRVVDNLKRIAKEKRKREKAEFESVTAKMKTKR